MMRTIHKPDLTSVETVPGAGVAGYAPVHALKLVNSAGLESRASLPPVILGSGSTTLVPVSRRESRALPSDALSTSSAGLARATVRGMVVHPNKFVRLTPVIVPHPEPTLSRTLIRDVPQPGTEGEKSEGSLVDPRPSRRHLPDTLTTPGIDHEKASTPITLPPPAVPVHSDLVGSWGA